MDKPQIFLHIEKSLNYTPFDVKWMPKSAKVITLGSHPKGTGAIQLYEMCEGDLKLIQDIESPKALKCGTFAASSLEERHLATCDFDGKLNIIDLTRPNSPIYSVKGHSEIINAIDGVGGLKIGKGAAELVTGSRDGTVNVWDPRQKDKPVISIEPEKEEEKRDCWAVAFGNAYSNAERSVCAGFDNGDIKLIDLRKIQVYWEKNLQNGVCSVQFDRKDIEMNKLVATTLESKFHVYDLRTFHKENGYAGITKESHKSTVWCVKHLPQNRDIFVTTGGNGSLNVWKYQYPSNRSKVLEDKTTEGVPGEVDLLQELTVSSQPQTSFDWSPDKNGLAACVGLDQTLRVVIVTKLNTY